MRKLIDISGQKFNKLLVIEAIIKNNKYYWKCLCDCGNVKYVIAASLKNNNTKSCGCLAVEQHQNMLKTREYKKHLLSDMTDNERIIWLKNKHWNEKLTLSKMSEIAKCNRITITRYFKKYNLKYRNISEDNKRRFENMSEDMKKEYPKKAQEKLRELLKDDEYYKKHIKRVHDSQNGRKSSIEFEVEVKLKELNIKYESQKMIGKFFIDFYLADYNLCLEVNGDYWHNTENQKKKDKMKWSYLTRNGYKFKTIWEHEINNKNFNKEYLINKIDSL